MKSATKDRIVHELEQLTEPQLERLLDSVDRLKNPPGIPGAEFLRRVSGLYPPAEAVEMLRAVEEGCETVDAAAW